MRDSEIHYPAGASINRGCTSSRRGRNRIKDNDSALSLVGSNMTGLGAAGGKVYLAEANRSRVVVLDGKTMAEVAAFPVPFLGSLALDGKGGLWVVERPGKELSIPYAAKDGDKPEVKGLPITHKSTTSRKAVRETAGSAAALGRMPHKPRPMTMSG